MFLWNRISPCWFGLSRRAKLSYIPMFFTKITRRFQNVWTKLVKKKQTKIYIVKICVYIEIDLIIHSERLKIEHFPEWRSGVPRTQNMKSVVNLWRNFNKKYIEIILRLWGLTWTPFETIASLRAMFSGPEVSTLRST